MQIESYKNWCEIDCYGKPVTDKSGTLLNEVKHNDYVEITWPSGKKEHQHVLVVKSKRTANDMGNTVDIPVSKAHIRIIHEGHSMMIPLTNQNIEVRRVV